MSFSGVTFYPYNYYITIRRLIITIIRRLIITIIRPLIYYQPLNYPAHGIL